MSTPPLPAGYALDATPPLPAGYALDSGAPAEQEKPGFLSQAWDKAVSMFPSKDEALRALGGSGVTAYHLATNPKEAFAKLAQESPGFAQTQEYLRSRQTGSSIPRSVLNAAGTLVGVDPAAEEAAAARGDTAGVAADAAVPAAAAIAGYGLHLGAPKIGAALSDVATNFKPQLMAGADALQHPTELPGRAIKAALNAIPDSPEVAADKQLKADAVAMRTRNLQARVAESKAADAAGQTVPEYRAAQKAAAKAAIPATPEASPIITSQSPDIPSEGRPATWRNLSVSDLASKGGPLTFDAAKQAQLRQLGIPDVGLVADPRATMGGDAIGSSADRLARLREIAGYPSLKGGPGDFTANRSITLNQVGNGGARPIVSPADQFESSFGPEHKEVGDLAEWETGNRQGVQVNDLDHAAKSMFGAKGFSDLNQAQKNHILRIAQTQVVTP